jgi:hypothetical protein
LIATFSTCNINSSQQSTLKSTGIQALIPTMIFLLDLLSPRYAPIQTCLLSCLGPGEIANITRTCRTLQCLWPTLRANMFDLDRKLKRFFYDPRAFRSVQGECNALIYGLWAQEFFARHDDLKNKICISVHEDQKALLLTYLESEGYTRYNPWPDDPHGMVQEGTTAFQKVAPQDCTYDSDSSFDTGCSCDVDCGCDTFSRYHMYVWLEHDEKSPFRNVLDRARTTAELNFITWNKAYCMYP